MRYLATLLERPGEEVTPLALVAAVEGHRGGTQAAEDGLSASGTGDAGPLLDEQARAAYRQRVEELRAEIDEAARFNDPERGARASEELAAVAQELEAATGKGGRARRSGSSAERARVNVTRAVRGAIARIAEHDPATGAHLDASVKTGDVCHYRPSRHDEHEVAIGGGVPAASELPPDLSRARERELVGRTETVAALDREWSDARAGRGRLVLVHGDAGIGKTRVVAEVAARLHAEGATILFGRCDEELTGPYQPFVQALRHHARGGRLPRTGVASSHLFRLVPELGAARESDPGSSDPETERYLLFEALADVMEKIAAAGPSVVVVDDAHWADRPTLLLLRHLQRAAEGLPILYLATARPYESPWRTEAPELLEPLRREGRLAELRLGGLELEETGELVRAVAGEGLPEGAVRELWDRTQGNPLFARETARHMEEGGTGLPETVRDVLVRRVGRLSERAREALTAAAVVGARFDTELLQATTGLTRDDISDALEEGLEAGVVRESVGGSFAFGHALMRDAIYAGLSELRRARLHAAAGRALEGLAVDSRAHVAELAFHFSQAGAHGDPALAVEYQVAAAEEALARLAYESAADHYRAAEELLAAGPGDDANHRRLELKMALGDAEWRAGRLHLSRDAYGAALELAERIDARAEYAAAALGMGFGMGMAASPGLQVDRDLIAALETALDGVGPSDRVLRAQLITKLGSALAWSEERDRALRLADEGISLARDLDDDRTLSAVLVEADTVFGDPADVRRCIAMTTEALAAAERAEDPYLQLLASLWRLPHLLQAAEIEDFRTAQEHTHTLAGRLRIPALLCLATNVDATVAQMEGRLDDAELLVQRFLELGQDSWNLAIADSAGAILLSVRLEQGRAEELLPAIDQLAAQNPDAIPWYHARIAIFAELGRTDEARSELRRFLSDGFERLPRSFVWLLLVSWTAEACVQTGERDVQPLYEALLPFEDQLASIWFASAVGSVAGYLGTYAHLLGEHERAAAHFERALEVNRRVGAAPYLALAQVRYASVLDEMGDPARAASLRDEARTAAGRLGLARIRRLLR